MRKAIALSTNIALVSLVLVLPNVTLIGIAVLLAHEYGHYLMALLLGAKPQMPFFMPIIFVWIGVTVVKRLHQSHKGFVALAGPLSGLTTSLLLAIISVMLGWHTGILACFAAGTMELFTMLTGPDGRILSDTKSRHGRLF